ncbi:uncharacterized protein G2W53_018698 [Senna tora]|uniref:Uncharacterized protein n=1 Tax=Senna tora TaxID=362788 RepID=A0A834U0X6_9FABA|nr:uncharacterized protein G2W53_018698 [Senna tora]
MEVCGGYLRRKEAQMAALVGVLEGRILGRRDVRSGGGLGNGFDGRGEALRSLVSEMVLMVQEVAWHGMIGWLSEVMGVVGEGEDELDRLLIVIRGNIKGGRDIRDRGIRMRERD